MMLKLFGNLRSWISAQTLRSSSDKTVKFHQTVSEKKKPPKSWRVYPQEYLLGERGIM